LSNEETQQTRLQWSIPKHYPFELDGNWNPKNEREWVDELSKQVEFLTGYSASLQTVVNELRKDMDSLTAPKTAQQAPKTTKKAPAKSGGTKK